MDKLPKHMLLCNFNKKLEGAVRKKFDLKQDTPVKIHWAEDGSCIWSIVLGDVEDVFSFLDYDQVQEILNDIFGSHEVQLLEEYYWPDNSSAAAFEEYKKSVGLTDPKIRCAAEMPEEYAEGWFKVYNKKAIVEISKREKK